MPTLLEQIRDAAVDSETKIGDVLRRCSVLASRLGHADFKIWVTRELEGYGSGGEVPDYRRLVVSSVGAFVGRGRQSVLPILPGGVPEGIQEAMTHYEFLEPAAVYEAHLRDSKGEELNADWPPGWAPHVKGYIGVACIRAHQVIPNGAVRAVVETVRSRILGFVLDLEGANPNAGEAIGVPGVPPERVTQIFNTHIAGNVGNVANASPGAVQVATLGVQPGNVESLERALVSAGVPELDLVELKHAVDNDPPDLKDGELGPRVRAWLSRTFSEIPAGIAADLVVRAILAFYGHHI